uniref:Uncharacterized protein n=1 Tax=Arundo donax TaxID=35708 RepID=A0A0A9EKA0_ARUDO
MMMDKLEVPRRKVRKDWYVGLNRILLTAPIQMFMTVQLRKRLLLRNLPQYIRTNLASKNLLMEPNQGVRREVSP